MRQQRHSTRPTVYDNILKKSEISEYVIRIYRNKLEFNVYYIYLISSITGNNISKQPTHTCLVLIPH